MVPYLRPAREAGRDKIPSVVIRDAGAVLGGERRQFGPRADERKITAQHIPELWKFIQTQEPQPVTDARHRERGFATLTVVAFIIPAHASELVKANGFLEPPDALLHNENRSPVVELDGKRYKRIENQREESSEYGATYIYCALKDIVYPRGAHIGEHPLIINE